MRLTVEDIKQKYGARTLEAIALNTLFTFVNETFSVIELSLLAKLANEKVVREYSKLYDIYTNDDRGNLCNRGDILSYTRRATERTFNEDVPLFIEVLLDTIDEELAKRK